MTAFTGRHVLVTGGNRGIGAAVARAFSAKGATVSLMVRDAASAVAVTETLSGPHCIVTADVTDREASQAACAEAASKLGPVDILINNAGSAASAPFARTDVALFQKMINEHLLAPVHTIQAVLPSMVERKSGHIVNIASIAGLGGAPYITAYVAAKHAELGLTRALAAEFRPQGISVNAVCPGYTDTDMVRRGVDRIVAKAGISADRALRSMLGESGQTRLVTVEEVADAVLALCSAPADAPTGQAVVVDGSTPR